MESLYLNTSAIQSTYVYGSQMFENYPVLL
jgi:hypothetical protein